MRTARRRVWWRWGSLVLLLLVLPLIWFGNRLVTGHFVPRTPYDGVMVCLLAMALVSLYAAYAVAVSLPKIAGVLLGVSTLCAMVNAADTPGTCAG
jgi:hypothetical protein